MNMEGTVWVMATMQNILRYDLVLSDINKTTDISDSLSKIN